MIIRVSSLYRSFIAMLAFLGVLALMAVQGQLSSVTARCFVGGIALCWATMLLSIFSSLRR